MKIVRKIYTAQKMKFSTTELFSKCNQIHSFLRIWSHLLKKSLMEDFIFCAVVLLLGELKGPETKLFTANHVIFRKFPNPKISP